MKKINLSEWENRFEFGISRVISEKLGLADDRPFTHTPRDCFNSIEDEQFLGYYHGLIDYLSEEA